MYFCLSNTLYFANLLTLSYSEIILLWNKNLFQKEDEIVLARRRKTKFILVKMSKKINSVQKDTKLANVYFVMKLLETALP